ncbi:MAG: hypothetical protein H0T76_12975 [Nannocystis sp.]|nr:hypothetical protein [Nannocystis sp.]MBA3547393.1 hypothetical protein [Nannocystis sp.]
MQSIVDAMLAEFCRDPRAALDRRPPKHDRDGRELARESLFSPLDIRRGRHITGRDPIRHSLTRLEHGVLTRLGDLVPGDRVADLVDRLEHRSLAAMEDAELRAAELTESPWSDDYWPVYLGGIGQRYADPKFPLAADWTKNYAYIQNHPVRDLFASGDQTAISRLSPAEKYDLLVGDPHMGLTTSSWAEGRMHHDQRGEVEVWLGISHGWASASVALPRPLHAVDTRTADGSRLRFFPADIKALASLLWAHNATLSRFAGGSNSNNSSDPQRGTHAMGINPDTFHLALVNQLGVARRSFIIDATHDYEIWNQPLQAYRYAYFNPQTLRSASTLADARVPIAAFDRDHFSGQRGPDTAAVVGVMMEVTYVRESIPIHNMDSASRDPLRTVRYLYDLELDRADDIIGGEWYTHKHPDFLWSPAAGARAHTPADTVIQGTWASDEPVPGSWRGLAWHSSATAASPLAVIVEALINRARR